MKSQLWLTSLVFGALFLAACREKPESEQARSTNSIPAIDWGEPKSAQPRLPWIKLWVGPEQLDTEVARTEKEQRTGMMFRRSMEEHEAMLFVFPYSRQASFWMKNCFVPLSIAYIDPEGVIQEIHDLQPHNTNSVFSASDNIRFALEVPQGWFSRHRVTTGMTVRTERGSLMETFGQQH